MCGFGVDRHCNSCDVQQQRDRILHGEVDVHREQDLNCSFVPRTVTAVILLSCACVDCGSFRSWRLNCKLQRPIQLLENLRFAESDLLQDSTQVLCRV